MKVEDLVKQNKERRSLAQELNLRAGEANLFPVGSREELLKMITARLAGARRWSEVKDPTALLVAAPDAELAELVQSENPDEIDLCGSRLRVEYGESRAPRVSLSREAVALHAWRDLPDAGVRLPGGRLVEVVVPFGYYDTISGTDLVQLKDQARARANRVQWDNWPSESRPAISLPDPAKEASVVPEIIECQYGTSVVDGAALVAHGAARLRNSRWYASDPYFEGAWYQTRADAETVRVAAVAKLEEIRKEALEQKRVAEARTAAETAKEALRNLRSHQAWWDLDGDLRARVEERAGVSLSYVDAANLPQWTEDSQDILERAQAALEVAVSAKADAERRAREATETIDAADRARLEGLLAHDGVCGNIGLARRIESFVAEAIKLRGTRAAELFREEEREAYGRASRRASLERLFPGLDNQGLDWAAGRDIVPVADWAEGVVAKPVRKAPTGPAAPPAPVAAVAASLDALKGRFNKRR